MNYSFIQQNKIPNFRYSNYDGYDKHLSWLFYESYVSTCDKLNACTKQKLLAHKDMIDSAIAMVKNQIARGLNGDSMNVKAFYYPQGFNMHYAHYVVNYVKWERKNKDKKLSGLGRISCAQKYWVYKRMIKTYGFRDKTKSSLFQAFVEFDSAVLKDGCIKLNLNMSNKAYKSRDKIFMDGFDLVFDNDEIKVRHVSEEVVRKVAENGIRQILMIDSNGSIHSGIIDENKSLNNAANEVYAFRTLHSSNSKFVCKVLNRIKSFRKPEDFHKDLERLRPSIKARLLEILKNTDASKVLIAVEDNSNNLHRELQRIFVEELMIVCRKLGLESREFSNERSYIEELAMKLRKSIKNKDYTLQPAKTDFVKWYEHLSGWLYLLYKNRTPYLFVSRKFMIEDMTEENEPQLDEAQSEKSAIKYPERPDYPDVVKLVLLFISTCDESERNKERQLAIKEHRKMVKNSAWQYYLDYCRLNKLKPIDNPNFADIANKYRKEYFDLYTVDYHNGNVYEGLSGSYDEPVVFI